MKTFRNMNPVLRATGVIGTVAALVTGVTFAALSSSATLTANTIASATADLQVSTDNISFGVSKPGFAFNGAVPGGAASPNKTFYLKNNGTSNLNLSLVLPALPTWTVLPSGSVTDTLVSLNITCTSGLSGAFSLTDNINHLFNVGSVVTGGPLQPTDTATCTANVSMGAGAFTGTGATSSNFVLTFTGAGV